MSKHKNISSCKLPPHSSSYPSSIQEVTITPASQPSLLKRIPKEKAFSLQKQALADSASPSPNAQTARAVEEKESPQSSLTAVDGPLVDPPRSVAHAAHFEWKDHPQASARVRKQMDLKNQPASVSGRMHKKPRFSQGSFSTTLDGDHYIYFLGVAMEQNAIFSSVLLDHKKRNELEPLPWNGSSLTTTQFLDGLGSFSDGD